MSVEENIGLIVKLMADGDLAKLAAASPGVQAKAIQVCNDAINLATSTRELIQLCTPFIVAAQKLNA